MEKIFWVLDFLAFSPQVSPEDKDFLKMEGVGAIVSLTLTPLKASDFPGMELLHLPMEEKVPSLPQLRDYFSFIKLMRTLKRKILTHCYAALERSPTMVASYLISAGYSPQEAILKIRSLSPSAINEEEERFLRELPVVLQADCLSEGSLFEEVLRVMRTLRGRCPWDKEQTHESLTKYLIEESWELNEAVAHKDPEKIKAELGDVLLQVVFHSVIGEEEGAFTTAEVLSGIRDKLIRRHPHVFGDPRALTPEGVEKQWESIKGEERRSDSEQSRRFMPALLRAERIQEIASHNGFDWKTDLGVLEKIKEETQELERSLLEASREKIVEEIGDLLFTLVNIARFLKINPEDALHRATDKFLKRYQKATDRIRKKGLNPSDLTLEELDAFWNESKSNRNSRKKYKS